MRWYLIDDKHPPVTTYDDTRPMLAAYRINSLLAAAKREGISASAQPVPAAHEEERRRRVFAAIKNQA